MADLQAQEGEFIYLGEADENLQFISSGVAVDRPTNPATLTDTVLTNVPQGTTVTVHSTSVTCDDGEVELSFEYPGTYTAKLECWPYLDKEFTIEITS
jgi:hypothetical protein